MIKLYIQEVVEKLLPVKDKLNGEDKRKLDLVIKYKNMATLPQTYALLTAYDSLVAKLCRRKAKYIDTLSIVTYIDGFKK